MSAVHASGVQTQCRPVSSHNQRCGSFRPFVSIVPRGVAAPIAPLLHRRLISVAPSALGGATSCKVQPVHALGSEQMHPSYIIVSCCSGADGPEEEQEIKLTRETEPDECAPAYLAA